MRQKIDEVNYGKRSLFVSVDGLRYKTYILDLSGVLCCNDVEIWVEGLINKDDIKGSLLKIIFEGDEKNLEFVDVDDIRKKLYGYGVVDCIFEYNLNRVKRIRDARMIFNRDIEEMFKEYVNDLVMEDDMKDCIYKMGSDIIKMVRDM